MRILRAVWRALTAPIRPLFGIDRWDVLSIVGAALLGGGVWRQWGSPWACMLWGSMLLTLAGLHAWKSGGR